MPDTIRTINELNALLGDNTTGDISAQDLRDVLVSMNVHTEIGFAGMANAIGTSFVKVPLDTAGSFERGLVADTVGNQISSTPVDLKALIQVETFISALDVGRSVDISVFVSGVEKSRLRRTFDSAGSHSWAVGVPLLQGDTIDLRIKADQAATNVTLGMTVLRAQRIGIE